MDRDTLRNAAVFRTTSYLDFVVLVVAGDVDISTADTFREHLNQLVDGVAPAVIVDLSLVSFIDSSGLGVLIGGLRSVRRAGGVLRVVGTSRQLTTMFAVTGIQKALPLHATVAAAAAT